MSADNLEQGVIGIKFFVRGAWTTVSIDYMLPCIEVDGVWKPVFCSPGVDMPDEKELWCCCEQSAAPLRRHPLPPRA